MKELVICFYLICGMGLTMQAEPCFGEREKVLLFIRNGSGDLDYTLRHEVGVMRHILEQAGFEVHLATVSGEPVTTDSIHLVPDVKLSDLVVTDYAGFMIPCMHAGVGPESVDPEAVEMAREVAEAEIPIAAQHAANIILARAGLLQGRIYTFHQEVNVDQYPSLNGSEYGGTGVKQDGLVITSGVCPYISMLTGLDDGTVGLTHSLIEAIRALKH
jgi:putative intracellular protease/amidase